MVAQEEQLSLEDFQERNEEQYEAIVSHWHLIAKQRQGAASGVQSAVSRFFMTWGIPYYRIAGFGSRCECGGGDWAQLQFPGMEKCALQNGRRLVCRLLTGTVMGNSWLEGCGYHLAKSCEEASTHCAHGHWLYF